MKKVLFMHGGSGNHGCEAIVRTTSELFNGPKDMLLWSFNKKEDEKYDVDCCFEKVVASEQIDKFSMSYFESWIKRNLLKRSSVNQDIFIRNLFKNSIAISVGGDNYCYPWSAKKAVEFDKNIRQHAKKTVLWACSVEKDSLSPEVCTDLEKFDLITAREQSTYELLKDINPNTFHVADPAFLLETKSVQLPELFCHGNMVGINISPLISRYVTDGEMILDNYKSLLNYIITETDMNICLIPHVIWKQNNDNDSINLLYDEFQNTGRVIRVDDKDCRRLKYIISKCRFFVGARTHATIAAYSTYVPTLVVGYSIKSIGIARDLFGTERNYVISVQDLNSENDLTYSFKWLIEHEKEVKNQLESVIPEYVERAYAKEVIQIINNWN